MSDGVVTYNPKMLVIVYGSREVDGFAEDDMVTIKPLGEGTQIYSGADGSVGRSMDPNQTYEVTIALATTSKTNDYFSNVYNLDRSTGRGILPLTIKDLSGTTVFQANQAWITNFPEHKRGRKIEAQEWVFHTGQVANLMIGGND
ncbi:DUF3277 family protein [Megamonas funiformis]|uniref:DUF3277 domain-containing protein n=1 Tax=Megamonas funiformis YIT 11815 TaxID=742816 RepID=A0ABP2NLN1_9FIRM|nr:phage protein [Megamonas funiformis]EHR38504.1 hypothetical protein HMPREF9454_00744 [Megamonas funiformis YIT 11815]QIB59934.1 DUF3277 family protein [Megamonas funiformis]